MPIADLAAETDDSSGRLAGPSFYLDGGMPSKASKAAFIAFIMAHGSYTLFWKKAE